MRIVINEARFVEGRAGGGVFPGRHAWVEAKIDGSWLTMDPTWASGYLTNLARSPLPQGTK